MKKILFLLFFALALHADGRVDIIANFNIADIPIEWSKVGKGQFDLFRVSSLEVYEKRSPRSPDLKKIIVMNNCLSVMDLIKLPKEKLVLFMWEPNTVSRVDAAYYQWFSRVYTWDDRLVDGVKFFKFYYPYLTTFPNDLPSFEQKKFCTLIASNWTKERLQMIDFFQRKPLEDFEFYGRAGGELAKCKSYRGPITGYHSGTDKIEVLKKYRFSICFENTPLLKGYVTEKIQNCFAAGCVPVYWGASNITSYIPKECYIDYRDFKSNEELYQTLKSMDEKRYSQYLAAIQKFLESEQAKIFSPECFKQIFLEAAK
jgi:hypothetical protein